MERNGTYMADRPLHGERIIQFEWMLAQERVDITSNGYIPYSELVNVVQGKVQCNVIQYRLMMGWQ